MVVGFGGQGEDGEIERLTNDREVWKEKVMERMEHLDRWERQKGYGYRWEQEEKRLVRNADRGEVELICRYVWEVGRSVGIRRGYLCIGCTE